MGGAVEYRGGTEAQVFPIIDEKIRGNTAEMLERMKDGRILPRQAAVAMARERVGAAMQYQRFNAGRRLKPANEDIVLRAAS
jgi:hypothetical protein